MTNLRIEKIKDQPSSGPWKDKVLVPYKNKWGHYVWKPEGESIDMTWPGFKGPKWAQDLILFNGIWYWASEE